MTEFSDEELVRLAAAREMGIDVARVCVEISRVDGFAQVSVTVDGKEPTGALRERFTRYMARYGGKELPSA